LIIFEQGSSFWIESHIRHALALASAATDNFDITFVRSGKILSIASGYSANVNNQNVNHKLHKFGSIDELDAADFAPNLSTGIRSSIFNIAGGPIDVTHTITIFMRGSGH